MLVSQDILDQFKDNKFIGLSIMKSLRTDDILGAKPRIRHAPRNLIHEQRSQQQQQYRDYPAIAQVNLSESIHEKSPPHAQNNPEQRYVPNMPNYASLEKLGDRRKELDRGQVDRRGAGIDSGFNQARRAALYEQYQDKYYKVTDKEMNHGMGSIDRRVPQQYIHPRESPVTTYAAQKINEQRLYREYLKNKNNNNDYSYDLGNGNGNNNAEEDRICKGRSSARSRQEDKPRSSSSREQYNQYKEYRDANGGAKKDYQNANEGIKKEEKPKNIFRGLGYNIITNSKFSYDMENDLKNSTSKWL